MICISVHVNIGFVRGVVNVKASNRSRRGGRLLENIPPIKTQAKAKKLIKKFSEVP